MFDVHFENSDDCFDRDSATSCKCFNSSPRSTNNCDVCSFKEFIVIAVCFCISEIFILSPDSTDLSKLFADIYRNYNDNTKLWAKINKIQNDRFCFCLKNCFDYFLVFA